MGAWADIDAGTQDLINELEGIGEEVIMDRSTGNINLGEVTPMRVKSAKGLVRRKIFGSRLGNGVDRYDTPEKMLDALADSSEVKGLVIEAIAYALLHLHEGANRIEAGGLRSETADDFEGDVDETIGALESVAPHSLGWTADTGSSGGGAFASTSHRSQI